MYTVYNINIYNTSYDTQLIYIDSIYEYYNRKMITVHHGQANIIEKKHVQIVVS